MAALARLALSAAKNPALRSTLTSSGQAYMTENPPPPPTGTPVSTYLLFIDIVFLLIGVILLVAANSKCAADPNGTQCKNHKNWGIAFTAICSILLVVILIAKYR